MTEEFNNWWDSDALTTQGNNFEKGTPAYWAWEGWQAALAAPVQEPPPWWPAVEKILEEYGLQAVNFVADFNDAMKDASQPMQDEDMYDLAVKADNGGQP
jgi:hypothetical protein